MQVQFNYRDELFEIEQMISQLPRELEDQEKEVLKNAGKIIKKNVTHFLKNSDIESRAKVAAPKNYDGTRPYKHVKDDVTYSIRKDKNRNLYVSVRGGKLTGYKWHLINDGHFARDKTTYVPGNNFMDKALIASQGEINQEISKMLEKVTR